MDHTVLSANTPCLPFLRKRSPDSATTNSGRRHPIAAYYSSIEGRPRRDERLNWPGWLTYSGRFTHLSGHPSATARAQDRESSRPKTGVLPLCHATNRLPWLILVHFFIFIFRPHHLHAVREMRPVATDIARVSCAKTAEPIEMPFGG